MQILMLRYISQCFIGSASAKFTLNRSENHLINIVLGFRGVSKLIWIQSERFLG